MKRWANFYRDLGARIAELRTGQSWTQHELAARLEMSRSTLAEIEAGRGQPRAHVLWQLANLLDVEVAVLFGERAGSASDARDATRVDEIWEELRILARKHGDNRSRFDYPEAIVDPIVTRMGGWARVCNLFGTEGEAAAKNSFAIQYRKYVRDGGLPGERIDR